MWLSLKVENQSKIVMVNRQTVRPKWGTGRQALTITTTTTFNETVQSVSERAIRLRYDITQLKTDVQSPKSPRLPDTWAAPKDLQNTCIELTLTAQATVLHLTNKESLPEPTLKRAESLGEDLRSCWVIPPEESTPGTQWTHSRAPAKDSLKHGIKEIHTNYHVISLIDQQARIEGRFEFGMGQHNPGRQVRGSVLVDLNVNQGIVKASRVTKVLDHLKPHLGELRRSDLLLQRL